METEIPDSSFSPLARPRLSLRRFLFYFITLAALVLIYLKFSELRLIKELFLRSNLFWLLAIIVVQILSYYFLALNYRDVLRIKDTFISVRELFPTTFAIQFLNQALPSAGLSGQAFFVQYLKKFGLTIAEGIGRAILELTTLYMAFGTFFIASAIMMLRQGILERHPEMAYFIYAFSFFAIIGVGLFFVLQKRERGKIARWLINRLHLYFEKRNEKKKEGNGGEKVNHSVHVAMIIDQFKGSLSLKVLARHGKAFWSAYLWQVVVMFLNFITLVFISHALGYNINLFVAFIVFTLTRFLGMVAFVPGALGIFEGGMTLMFISFGTPANIALAVTLLFRAFTFWLPMPVGWILYRWYLHRQELENPYS